jgi:hypothetical protein
LACRHLCNRPARQSASPAFPLNCPAPDRYPNGPALQAWFAPANRARCRQAAPKHRQSWANNDRLQIVGILKNMHLHGNDDQTMAMTGIANKVAILGLNPVALNAPCIQVWPNA